MTRGINNNGFKINTSGDRDTQLLIISKHIDRLLDPFSQSEDKDKTYDGVIYDRCILDGYVYTNVLKSYSDSIREDKRLTLFAFDCLIDYISYYDHIFYLPPLIPLVDDGQRSTDVEFASKVEQKFLSMINWINSWSTVPKRSELTPPKITIIKETILDKRVKKVVKLVNKK